MADTYTVERSAQMAGSPDAVYALISDFHNWPRWSPWEELDPGMQRTHSGAESGVGAVYEWSGNRKAGKGRMEITDAVPARRVGIKLDFEKPFKSSNTTTFALQEVGPGTRVTWTMTGSRPLVMKLLSPFFKMDKIVGKDFEKGLANLKRVAST